MTNGSRRVIPPYVSGPATLRDVATADELAQAWDALQARHPELPDVSVLPSTRARSLDCWDVRWDSRPVVLEAGRDVLDMHPADAMTWLLHKAAHALSGPAGGLGTGSRGKWHTASYRDNAEQLGLSVSQGRGGTGWSETELSWTLLLRMFD